MQTFCLKLRHVMAFLTHEAPPCAKFLAERLGIRLFQRRDLKVKGQLGWDSYGNVSRVEAPGISEFLASKEIYSSQAGLHRIMKHHAAVESDIPVPALRGIVADTQGGHATALSGFLLYQAKSSLKQYLGQPFSAREARLARWNA